MTQANPGKPYDLLIIGGGINGAGIARDAAGRGYSVCLCEKGDFASGTSSASTKLFHGGLRYLEYLEIRLVREALIERERLLAAMPHISWPMRFILPYHEDMRFEADTPVSKILTLFMPWLKGRRPAWLIRLGLFLYDHLGGRKFLPATTNLDLQTDIAGKALKPIFKQAYQYSDCWVDDARLVILNLQDASQRGAQIYPRTKVNNAQFQDGKWDIELKDVNTKECRTVQSKMIINAAGPWVDHVLEDVFGIKKADNIRLVRGSHIVVRRKFEHDRCYFFQNPDSRIIFAIPYEQDFTLIGTTDADHGAQMHPPKISDHEKDYLCTMASQYFKEPVTTNDIVWTYSGVRPLYDDGASKAREATRDYVIRRSDNLGNASVLNIFGGKITTYRKLAESMLEEIEASLGKKGEAWTENVSLPGGDFPIDGFDALLSKLYQKYPFVDETTIHRMARLYGTKVEEILGDASNIKDLGHAFGCGLFERELQHLIANEWARTTDDILLRRTKLGLKMSDQQKQALNAYLADHFQLTP